MPESDTLLTIEEVAERTRLPHTPARVKAGAAA